MYSALKGWIKNINVWALEETICPFLNEPEHNLVDKRTDI